MSKHFLKITSGVDILPLQIALFNNPQLWNASDVRTTFEGSPHREVDDILLRFNKIVEGCEAELIDATKNQPYPAWETLAVAQPIVFDLMRRVKAVELGRVMITRLPPGKQIFAHVDEGAPATYFTRFQLAIQNAPGSLFNIGCESMNFQTGDVWLVDNNTKHSVVNNSATDRIVMIMDMRIEP